LQGDGGGPLACEGTGDNTERFFLTGITSWGVGCGTKGIPGMYTDVRLFFEWIDQTVKKLIKEGDLKQWHYDKFIALTP